MKTRKQLEKIFTDSIVKTKLSINLYAYYDVDRFYWVCTSEDQTITNFVKKQIERLDRLKNLYYSRVIDNTLILDKSTEIITAKIRLKHKQFIRQEKLQFKEAKLSKNRDRVRYKEHNEKRNKKELSELGVQFCLLSIKDYAVQANLRRRIESYHNEGKLTLPNVDLVFNVVGGSKVYKDDVVKKLIDNNFITQQIDNNFLNRLTLAYRGKPDRIVIQHILIEMQDSGLETKDIQDIKRSAMSNRVRTI